YPLAEEFRNRLRLLRMAPEPLLCFPAHPRAETAIRQSALACPHLGKPRIDPRQGLAHLGMNLRQQRAGRSLVFRFGEHPAGGIRLDGAPRELTRGDAFLATHLLELLHAPSR